MKADTFYGHIKLVQHAITSRHELPGSSSPGSKRGLALSTICEMEIAERQCHSPWKKAYLVRVGVGVRVRVRVRVRVWVRVRFRVRVRLEG